ncbi:multicopy suppressor of a budding defect [Sporothrix epigloea]|uniref:Multicopy suppressor of a budding defect n=1 Tax=Sporothrix epigloea TaxID=1892477 RepID=A0ABP0DD65_9PEZI
MHTSSLLVAFLAAAASVVGAQEDRPRIYFPRHIKRVFVNATSTQHSPHAPPPPTNAPVILQSSSISSSLSELSSSKGDSSSTGTTKRQTPSDIFSSSQLLSRSDDASSASVKRTASSQARDDSTASEDWVTTVIIATSTIVVPPSSSTPIIQSSSTPIVQSSATPIVQSSSTDIDTNSATSTEVPSSQASTEASSSDYESSSDIVVLPHTSLGRSATISSLSDTTLPTSSVAPKNPLSSIDGIISSILKPKTTATPTSSDALSSGISHTGVGTGVSSSRTGTATPTDTGSPTDTDLPTDTGLPTSILSSIISSLAGITTTNATSSLLSPTSTESDVVVTPLTTSAASLPTSLSTVVPTTAVSLISNGTETIVPITSLNLTSSVPATSVVLPTTTVNSTLIGNATEAVTAVSNTQIQTSEPVSLASSAVVTPPANTPVFIPTTIMLQPSPVSVESTGQTPTTATGLPTGLPKAITPDTSNNPAPDDTTEIQIAFGYGLNYAFVAVTPKAAAQVLKILPELLSYQGGFDQSKSVVQRLVPYDTTSQLGYVTMLAICTYPTTLVDQLRMDMHIPTAALWNDPDQLAYNMSQEINPAIDIILGSTLGYSATGTAGNFAASTTGGSSDPFTNNNSSDQTSSQRGITAGIAVGAIFVSAAYGGAMFIIARRYKRKKQSVHRHSDSLTSHSAMRQTGSPALMGGALLSRDFTSTYGAVPAAAAGGRNSHGSGRSNTNSARTAFISAPMAAENSLGWN